MSEREEYEELECDDEDGDYRWDDEICEECGCEGSDCCCDEYEDEMDIDYDEEDYE
jgi:hypothetical protein